MTLRTRASLARHSSSGAVNSKNAPAKTRRSHRKSRNGCTECKHRHIRCDERQPSCANCEIAERVCSFLTPQVGKHQQKRAYQYHAERQRRSEAVAALPAGLEAGIDINTNEEHAQQPSPLSHHEKTPSDRDRASEQLLVSHRSLPMHYPLPRVTGLDAGPHQIPSPAPPVQPGDVPTPPSDCCPGLFHITGVVSKALFTPQHMILLHHAGTVPNMTGPDNRNAVDIAIRYAIGSPYLLDEILAFTAFHLSGIYPGSATYLRQLATELQTRALASFTRVTETVPYDDEATAVPRFLFSGILGRHVLADTLLYCRSDFRSFIDRFVDCINLNRGIRAVTPRARDYLYNSELQPFLSIICEAEKKIVSPGTECDALSHLMDDSDLNEDSISACRQAIVVLQWCFDLCHNIGEEDYPQSVSAFSVRIEANFVDVLRKHRPEALVILAYYGVLLYRCRSFWAFADAGACMVRAIAGQLGTYWQAALAWPLLVLETEQNSESLPLVPRNDTPTMSSSMLD